MVVLNKVDVAGQERVDEVRGWIEGRLNRGEKFSLRNRPVPVCIQESFPTVE